MNILIVASLRDQASLNIKESLTELTGLRATKSFDNNPIYEGEIGKHRVWICTIQDELITCDNLDQEAERAGFRPDRVIFISRHKSASGVPTLSVHPIGNFSEAKFGGRAKTLVKASPLLMTQSLRILKAKAKNLKFEVCFEVTHHGPWLDKQTFFIEIGSTKKEWNNKLAGKAIAETLIEVFKKPLKKSLIGVGIGGSHYAPKFTEVALKSNYAFGHLIPNYHLESKDFDESLLNQAYRKSGASTFFVSKQEIKPEVFEKIEKALKIYKVFNFFAEESPSNL
jgi:D-aminoacyl-tRNA deacylase